MWRINVITAAKSSTSQTKCMAAKKMNLFARIADLKTGTQIPMNNTEQLLRNEVSRTESDIEAAAYELQQSEKEHDQAKEELSKYLSELSD